MANKELSLCVVQVLALSEYSATILCTGGLDVIRKEAWPFYRTISGVRLCWELEEHKGPKGSWARRITHLCVDGRLICTGGLGLEFTMMCPDLLGQS